MTHQVKLSPSYSKQQVERVGMEPEIIPYECNLISECRVNKHSPVTSLVGKQCLVTCYLNGHKTEALWDTGSQVCIVDRQWKDQYIPGVKIREVFEAMEATDNLNLVAANGSIMPYVGWVEITFNFGSPCRQDERISHPCTRLKRPAVVQANHWLQCN